MVKNFKRESIYLFTGISLKYDKMDKYRKKIIESAITSLEELQSIQQADASYRRVFKNIYIKYKDLFEFSLKKKASNIHIQFYRLISLLKIFVELTNWYFEGEESVHKFSRLAWEDGMTYREYENYVISEYIDLYIGDDSQGYSYIGVDFQGYSYHTLLPLEFNDSLKKKYIRGH